MRSSKESLEVGLHFLLWSETFPNFSVIDEETGLINKLEGHNDELFEAVRIVAGSSVVDAIFDLVEKGFNQLVDIVRVQKIASFS